VNGPCVTTADLDTVEVFARGQDKHIYRKVNTSAAWAPTWTSIAGLDGSVVDARSDLDCSANSTTVHIVATGNSPSGALIHASGFGTSYNPFLRELPSQTFDPSATVTTIGSSGGNDVRVAGTLLGMPTLAQVGATSRTYTPITNAPDSPVTAMDLAWEQEATSDTTYLAYVNANGKLAVYRYVNSSNSGWAGPWTASAPAGTVAYEFSPSVCVENPSAMGAYEQHVVVTAGGKLWQAASSSAFDMVSAWEQIGAGIASSPDCVVMRDGRMHVVALGASGTIIDVVGKSGGPWTTTDLKTY